MSIYTLNDLPQTVSRNLVALTSDDDILKLSKPLRDKFGITYFAHTISFYDGKATTLITNHEVVIHWILNQYIIPGNDHKGNHLPSGYYLLHYMGELYPKAYRKAFLELFNIDHMLMIVDSNKFYSDIFTFGTEPDNYKIMNFYLNNIEILKKFIIFFKEKANSLTNKTMHECLFVPPAKQIVTASWSNGRIIQEVSVKNIQLGDNLWLTKREIECLLLTSKGKTAKAVARIMKISPRTVEYHLGASKDKLGCRFKSELIERFMNILDKNFLL